MGIKYFILLSCFFAPGICAKEPLTASYKEADAAFERLSQESNTMGLISYCQLRDAFPHVNATIAQRIASSFDDTVPQEDRQTRATLLFSMVNMYAGGVAQGLSMSHTRDNASGPDKTFCETVAKVARGVFPAPAAP